MNSLLQRIVTRWRRSRLADQRGQAWMEYVLLTVILLCGTMPLMSVLFQRAIKAYLLPIYFWVSLPFP
jgi:hypothetical protein